MCQCTLFDVGGVEIHSIECIEYCTKDQSNVEDVEDRSNTHKGCNAMYVEDVEDIKTSHNRCILKYVEDVEDRSNTHKGCNAMYVEDVEDIKMSHNRCILKYVEDVEDRSNTHKGCNAMYVEDVEDGKITYHTFWLITSLILNGFSIRKKFWKAETESFPTIPSNFMYVEACRRCQR